MKRYEMHVRNHGLDNEIAASLQLDQRKQSKDLEWVDNSKEHVINQIRAEVSLIGKLANLRILGAGGQGITFRALRICDQMDVALKVIHPVYSQFLDPGVSLFEVRERLFREHAVARVIVHEVVLRPIELIEHDNLLILVREYFEGLSLHNHVKQFGPISVGLALTILKEVSSAMEDYEKLGVVHRDLTPGNLLVGKQGGRWVIRIIDFGIASCPLMKDAIRFTSGHIGTRDFVAPEQTRADPTIDIRADVYSLGRTVGWALCSSSHLPLTNRAFNRNGHRQLRSILKRMTETSLKRRLTSPRAVIRLIKESSSSHEGQIRSNSERGRNRLTRIGKLGRIFIVATSVVVAVCAFKFRNDGGRVTLKILHNDGWIKSQEEWTPAAEAKYPLLLLGSYDWHNYILRFEAIRESRDCEPSAMFLISSRTNLYSIRYGAAGGLRDVLERQAGSAANCVTIERTANRLGIGSWHRVQIAVQGDEISSTLDDQRHFSSRKVDISAGAVGFRCIGSAARLRNVTVTTPDGIVRELR